MSVTQAAPGPGQPRAGAYALQPFGAFHGEEVVARDGEQWLVLWRSADGELARLAPAKLRIVRIHDPIMDTEVQATGREVSIATAADHAEDAVMSLRGPALRTGPVVSADVEDRSAGGLPAMRLRLGKRAYAIDTRCEPIPTPADRDASQAHLRCRIELSEGGMRHTLVERLAVRGPGGPELLDQDATPQILFAGDLDRDGRLDLIFNTSDHYNVGQPTLFLSGAAGKGRLLRSVARFRSVGC
jgi:hypothetical protein